MRALLLAIAFVSCAGATPVADKSFYTIVSKLYNEIAYRDAEIRRLRTQIQAQPRCS